MSALPVLISHFIAEQPRDNLRTLVPAEWYKRASAILRVALTPGRRYPQLAVHPDACTKQMEQIRQQGFSAIEIFAPSYGGKSFNGLDTKDYFRIDPGIGTMQAFEVLVGNRHKNQVAVIIFTNLGHSSAEAPFFLKALQQLAYRRKLPTLDDAKHYAVLRSTQDGSDRVLLVFNLQPSPQQVKVDVSGVFGTEFRQLNTGNSMHWQNPLAVNLPASGLCVSICRIRFDPYRLRPPE